jgi:hypothetical protein
MRIMLNYRIVEYILKFKRARPTDGAAPSSIQNELSGRQSMIEHMSS